MAEESGADLASLVRDTDLLFLFAGLGGGTGTGIAPVVAKAGKKAGALVIAFVTTPFQFEGSRPQKQAQQGLPPAAIFGFSLLFVFLILAALYESWSLPLSVLLSTPIAVFGAFGMLCLRRAATGIFSPPFLVQIENNIFAQIGLVMIIGLVAKNAILIVEFAKVEYERGASISDAALTGARLRLRPILMTSFAFILGCVPLWTASGSGALSRTAGFGCGGA